MWKCLTRLKIHGHVGNNLWMWSRMPDDREGNFTGTSANYGAYPIMKRVNFGIKFSL